MGSADSQDFDQVLDSVLVGPVGPGQYKFVLQVTVGHQTLRICNQINILIIPSFYGPPYMRNKARCIAFYLEYYVALNHDVRRQATH